MDEEKKNAWTAVMWIAVVFLIVMLLCGCSRKTPVSEINDGIQQEVVQLVDYANNNMDMDADKQLLLKGAQHCAARANDLTHTCEETIRAYKTEASGWKLATTLMSIIAALLGLAWIRK
jgi:outer membrane murein-binding lipoprotein Lpp